MLLASTERGFYGFCVAKQAEFEHTWRSFFLQAIHDFKMAFRELSKKSSLLYSLALCLAALVRLARAKVKLQSCGKDVARQRITNLA